MCSDYSSCSFHRHLVVYCFSVCSCPCGCQHPSVHRTNIGETINIRLDLAATASQVTKEDGT